MTSDLKQCVEEARKQKLDDGPTIVRQAVRLTLDQVVDELRRATERLNEKSRSRQTLQHPHP
jgi:hypothetical protein